MNFAFILPTFLFVVIVLIALLLPVIALVDIVRHEFKSDSNKLIWVLLIFFLPFLGSILYFTIGVNDKIKT